ncbi:alkane 1-monooxygenase [Noviherbaspirillum massiliense]|uniref:alkane 1-monooxygenase n=1 Tax=Noviherbaspirillum massiliense TaxID=1465823 RepID=UPI00031709E7|nr:alkane 1-monooxygenase [Noviherbaspirillum massiliense]
METMQLPSTLGGYRDRKRYAWLMSLVVPCLICTGPLLYTMTGQALLLWTPVFLNYLVIPFIDILLGDDLSNPPEDVVPALEADRYYRYVTYALVPLLWGGFIFGVWFFTTHPLPWHAMVAGVMTTGGVGGFGINLGHELGHKRGRLERNLAKAVLAMTGYGHFTIEHNRGHHRDVATPADPASSRMGENIYRFLLREMPGGFKRAWQLEKQRLAQEGKSVWSLQNEILQPLLLTVIFFGAMTAWLGWTALPFMLLAAFWSNFQLTSANYIEHYGLLRQKLPSGRYEPCQPRHSWNSNQLFSNWAVFHLQRHSDHHAHPLRRYQSLRHFEDVPQLPNGYFGMFPISYIPPLWFRMMDRRLVEAVKGDPERINFDPAKRERLMRRYGMQVRAAEAAG